jgi:pyrroline-5-carboxylate reductase
MDKIGFIGYGHMGSILLKSLLSTKAISPGELIVSTRTREKLDELIALFPAIEIAKNNLEVALKISTIFLCVGTYQVLPVLSEVKGAFQNNQHLIFISGGLEIASIERLFTGPITKVIPTLISEVKEGVTLICHNTKVSPAQKAYLWNVFHKIGKVKVIAESQFEIGADFTRFEQGLLAAICEQFVQAGTKHSDFTYEELTDMLLHSLNGTARLLLQNREGFKTLIDRVATKGGATEGGASVLESRLPDVFEQVFDVTSQRHETRKQKTREQLAKGFTQSVLSQKQA